MSANNQLLSFPSDLAGLASLPDETESGTSAPFLITPGTTGAVTGGLTFAPGTPSAAPTPTAAVVGVGAVSSALSGAAASWVAPIAQYGALALLAVILLGIGAFVLLKD